MPYTIVGSEIHGALTNANLSTLSGLAGVTTTTVGHRTFYNIGTLRFKVLNGSDCTIDPTIEQIVHHPTDSPLNSVQVDTGGILRLGKKTTVNGATVYTRGVAISNPDSTLPSCCDNASFRVYGTLIVTGATLETNSCMNFEGGSTITLDDAILQNRRGSLARIRMFSTALTVNTTLVEGGISWDMFRAPQQMAGLAPRAGDRGLEYIASTAGGTNDEYINAGYASEGLNYDFSIWDGADTKFPDSKVDIDCAFGPNGTSIGLAKQTGTYQVTLKDSAGSAIQGAKVYWQDFDNGSRSARTIRSGVNYGTELTKTYVQTTNASGVASDEVWVKLMFPSGTTRALTGSTYMQSTDDWRTENSDGVVSLKVVAYGYLYTTITADFISSGEQFQTDWTVFANTKTTQTNKTLVDAYTTQETPARAYDFGDAKFIDGYAGEVVKYIDRDGTTLVLGTKNLTALPTGSFAQSASSVTLIAPTFTGDITTTGTVSLQAIAEGRTITGASTITLASYPTTLTVDNSIVNVAGAVDVSNWSFENGSSLRLTANATVTTGGQTGLTINANGFVLTRIDTLATSLVVTNLTGQNISVYRNGTLFASTVAKTGTYTVNIPTTDHAQTFTYKIRKYAEVSKEGTLTTQQVNNVLYVPVADSGITQATQATVGAYTTLDNPDELYDYLRYYSTTVAGMALPVIGTIVGDELDLTGYNLVIDSTAGVVFAKAGTTLTIKSPLFEEGS